MIKKVGYGQVEPNHLSAQRTGQIYAQSPCVAEIENLENGSFLKIDPATNLSGKTGSGEWMLVYNEVKLYNNAFEGYKDFRLTKAGSAGGVLIPRLFKTNVGDRFTTNMIEGASVEAGDQLVVAEGTEAGYTNVGMLKAGEAAAGEIAFEVVKVYTMPDGTPGVKVVRVQ